MFSLARSAASVDVSPEKGVGNVSIADFNSGNIQKQCSPWASGSPRWGWHPDLRMLQVHFIATRVTICSFILNIHVSCLFPPPLYFRRCHNVTGREGRHAGECESSAGHQPCYDGASWHTQLPPPPLSEKQEARSLMVKINTISHVKNQFLQLQLFILLFLSFIVKGTIAYALCLCAIIAWSYLRFVYKQLLY